MILEIIENIIAERERYQKTAKVNEKELEDLYSENCFLRMHLSKKIV